MSVLPGGNREHTVFITLLVIASMLFSATIVMLAWVNSSEAETRRALERAQEADKAESEKLQREMRLMQLHFEEFNAILVRDGLVKPGDYLRGPTNAAQPLSQPEVK